MAVLCCGMPQSKAAGRATEILEKLAAGFRAMPGYSCHLYPPDGTAERELVCVRGHTVTQ